MTNLNFLFSNLGRGESHLNSTCLRSASVLPPFRVHYLRYAAVALFILLGVGDVWGANIVIDLNLTQAATYPNTFPTTTGTTSGTYTFGEYSFGFSCNTAVYRSGNSNGSYYILIGKAGVTESNASVITFPAISGYKLTEVKLSTPGTTGENVAASIRSNYATVLSGGTAWTFAKNSSNTWTLTGTAANTAYKMYIVRASGNSTYNGQLSGLKLTYEPVAQSCDDPDTELSVGASATPIYAGATSTLSTSGGNGSTVTYSVTSDNSSYATISGTTFSATRAGTYTIQASQDEDGGVCGGTSTVNITVRYRVKWSVNGDDTYSAGSPTTYIGTHNTKVSTLPTAPGSALCDGSKVFVGWTTSSYSHASTAPATLFTTASGAPNVTDNVTYYAVFANRSDFTRVTATSQLAAGKQIVVVDNANSKVLTTTPGYTTAPTESSSKITPSDNMIWTLEASSTNWKLKTGSSYLGVSTTTSGTAVSLTTTNSTWTIAASTASGITNCFYLKNTNGTNFCLEYYSSGSEWVAYQNKNYATSTYFTERLYVATLSNYATSCCTPLAQINGSVLLSKKTLS